MVTNQTNFTPDELRHLAFITASLRNPDNAHGRPLEALISAAMRPEVLAETTDVQRIGELFRIDTAYRFDFGWGGIQSAASSGLGMEKLAALVLSGKINALKKWPAVAILHQEVAHCYVGTDGKKYLPLTDLGADRDLETLDVRPAGVEIVRNAEVVCWPSLLCHIKGRPSEARFGLYRASESDRFTLCTLPATSAPCEAVGAFLPYGVGNLELRPGWGVFELPRTEAGDAVLREHGLFALVSESSVIIPVKFDKHDGGAVHHARWDHVLGVHEVRSTGHLYGASHSTPFMVAGPGRGSWITSGTSVLTAEFNGQGYDLVTPKKAGRKNA